MFPRLILPALALAFALPSARAADAPTSWPNDATITALAFAPDGQSLWSVNRDGELTVRAGDGKAEIYRGSLPGGGEARVLKDGSFVFGANDGILTWFEPPQQGQALRVHRRFVGPEARIWKQMEERTGREMAGGKIDEPMSDEMKQLLWKSPYFGAIAVSPDEKRVAYSFLIYSIENSERSQEVIRVWNLETGAAESEQKVEWRGFVVYNRENKSSYTTNASLPADTNRFNVLLAWADAQTLVVARGLALERFDATTGEKLGEWKPLDAPAALARANLLRMPQYAGKSPAELDILLKTAQPQGFDAGAQKLLALSRDGKQLLVFDNESLVTLWDSATGEAHIVVDNAGAESEGSEFVPKAAKFMPFAAEFSPDGTKVAAWERDAILVWSRQGQTMIYAGDQSSGSVALSAKQIAHASGGIEVSTMPYFNEIFGRIMRPDKSLK